MSKYKQILNEVLKEIKPSKDEEKHVNKLVSSVLAKLNKALKGGAKAVLGGSSAKGTWLKDNHEIDIFVVFDKEEDISDKLEKALKKCFSNAARIVGSRDYFQIYREGYTIEFVPIIRIKKAEEALNITDISILHVGWVNKHLKKKDEARLLKQFARAHKVYGAESHIKGFSGYVIEILTVYYGGFIDALKGISKLPDQKVIDPKKYHTNVMFALNKSKLQSPLILVDPVDRSRNAAAALGLDAYKRIIKACKAFLKKPSRKFFVRKKFDIDEFRRRIKKYLIVLEVKPLKGRSDVVGCKLIKAYEMILRKLKEFDVEKSGWEWDDADRAYFWYVFKSRKISATKKLAGPPVKIEQHAEAFKKKYKKTFVKAGRLYADVKRDYTDAMKLMEDVLKDKFFKEKVKSIKIK